MQAEALPSTWPLGLKRIGPPSIMRDVMFVWRIASVVLSSGCFSVRAQG